MTSIGENIKVLRLARGWTQEELAQRLHLTRQAVGHYESGRTVPDIDTCRRLAEVFGVELEVLLEGEGEPVKLPKWLWGLVLGTAGLPLLVRSVIMVVNQRLYPLYNAGTLPEGQRLEITEKHFALSDAANAVEAASYAAFFAVLIVLVWWYCGRFGSGNRCRGGRSWCFWDLWRRSPWWSPSPFPCWIPYLPLRTICSPHPSPPSAAV